MGFPLEFVGVSQKLYLNQICHRISRITHQIVRKLIHFHTPCNLVRFTYVLMLMLSDHKQTKSFSSHTRNFTIKFQIQSLLNTKVCKNITNAIIWHYLQPQRYSYCNFWGEKIKTLKQQCMQHHVVLGAQTKVKLKSGIKKKKHEHFRKENYLHYIASMIQWLSLQLWA